jgi:hypothetical protein
MNPTFNIHQFWDTVYNRLQDFKYNRLIKYHKQAADYGTKLTTGINQNLSSLYEKLYKSTPTFPLSAPEAAEIKQSMHLLYSLGVNSLNENIRQELSREFIAFAQEQLKLKQYPKELEQFLESAAKVDLGFFNKRLSLSTEYFLDCIYQNFCWLCEHDSEKVSYEMNNINPKNNIDFQANFTWSYLKNVEIVFIKCKFFDPVLLFSKYAIFLIENSSKKLQQQKTAQSHLQLAQTKCEEMSMLQRVEYNQLSNEHQHFFDVINKNAKDNISIIRDAIINFINVYLHKTSNSEYLINEKIPPNTQTINGNTLYTLHICFFQIEGAQRINKAVTVYLLISTEQKIFVDYELDRLLNGNLTLKQHLDSYLLRGEIWRECIADFNENWDTHSIRSGTSNNSGDSGLDKTTC